MKFWRKIENRLLRWHGECGHVEAMTRLGVRYMEAENFVEATHWLRKAAEQDFPSAQLFLGSVHDSKEDYVEAVHWYRLAAKQGDAAAQHALASMYLLGNGVAKDIPEAIRWYRKAAEQGDLDTQILLGKLYSNGQFLPSDYAEAVFWYSAAFKASSLTHSKAEKYAKELEWFLSAAEAGDGDVLLNVANIYSSCGGGVPQDNAEALRWYRLAADKGNEEALCFIGHMYETGKGISQDFVEAMRSYLLAAEKGNAGAMFNIGSMYTRSQGVSIDPREIYFWFYLCSTYPLPQLQADHVKKALEVLNTKLAPESMDEIRRRAQRWIETHPKIHL